MRLPRFAALALTVAISSALPLAGCSSSSEPTSSASSAPAPATSAPFASSLLPLPEASLGAQGTDRVKVELFLKSSADVAEQVDATVAFRSDGKEFTRATISQALQPGEALTVVVTPDYTGEVPMGYTSAIVALKASDHVVVTTPDDAAAASASPADESQSEPAGEAVPPSDEAAQPGSAQASTPAEPTGEQVESAGDFVCHAGIDSLPDLVRGSKDQADVVALQVVLAQVGYSPGPIDGLFGKRTEAAVTSFQNDFGLTVDGQVGPRTWEALVKAYC